MIILANGGKRSPPVLYIIPQKEKNIYKRKAYYLLSCPLQNSLH